ncbi:transposase, partial [Acidiphilium sp.]|uniref:transposase n=1 Tax=Acidiphilium sp. TaxID=527 RepID=UPI003D0625D6
IDPILAHSMPLGRPPQHKSRNIIDRLSKSPHTSVRKALRQAWELDSVDKAEQLLRNLACRHEQIAPGVAGSILEEIDGILTALRLGLPPGLRRSLASTNLIENMMGTIRRVSRNVTRRRNARMALHWAGAGMMEATEGFRKPKAYKQLPALRSALVAHPNKDHPNADLAHGAKAA